VTDDEPTGFVSRDKRKIDPETGEVRRTTSGEDAAASSPGAADSAELHEPAAEGQVPMVEAALYDERTRDLQRVQAEYANYRKRAERDRLAAGDLAVGRTLNDLLPVIDDLDRARAHGDLTGGLKAVADTLDGVFAKLGLTAFGEVGDPFDPSIHEAVLHDESDDVTEPTCTTIMRVGYRHKDRLLRPAMVGVSDPTERAAANGGGVEGEGPAQADSQQSPAQPHEDEDRTTADPTQGK
jgi:molecular chaperone GrpE